MEKTVSLSEPKPEISITVENYLQAIYKLKERGERVSPTRLAEAMGVSVATAVGMLKRLARQGMVTVSENREVSFTHKGEQIGESVVRRHRLAERLLTELLDVEWYRAHEEAHRFEHAISPHVEGKVAKALGYPKTNPFGYPIPGHSNGLVQPAMVPLTHLATGQQSSIERIPDEDLHLLKYLDGFGVRPGVQILVKEVAPYKGTVTLVLNGNEMVLGTEVAATIMARAPGH